MARSIMSGTRGRLVRAVSATLSAIALVAVALVPAAPAAALSGSSFDPRYIISDSEFYSSDAMSAAEIQSFLDSMARRAPTPTASTSCAPTRSRARPTGTVCGPYTGAASESTASILFKVQQSCGISARCCS